MINLRERKIIIEKEFNYLTNYGFNLVENTIMSFEESVMNEDKITIVFESDSRIFKIQYVTKINFLNKKREKSPQYQLSNNLYEYTLFDIKAKNTESYSDFSVNNYVLLTNRKLYFQKFNTYNQKYQKGITNQEYLLIINNYKNLLNNELSDIMKGKSWISMFNDRLDGWMIYK